MGVHNVDRRSGRFTDFIVAPRGFEILSSPPEVFSKYACLRLFKSPYVGRLDLQQALALRRLSEGFASDTPFLADAVQGCPHARGPNVWPFGLRTLPTLDRRTAGRQQGWSSCRLHHNTHAEGDAATSNPTDSSGGGFRALPAQLFPVALEQGLVAFLDDAFEHSLGQRILHLAHEQPVQYARAFAQVVGALGQAL